MGISKPKDEAKQKEKEGKKQKKEKVKVKAVEARSIIRIANTDLDGDKPVPIALKRIKGVGFSFARAIVNVLNIDPNKRLKELSEEEIKKIEDLLQDPSKYGFPSFMLNRRKDYETGKDKHLIAEQVVIARKFDIEREIKMRSYKGWRHMLGQPVRGQRTRSHFRSGKTVGVVRKKK